MKLVKEKRIGALSALMGSIMEKLRGRVDGKIVHEILKKKLEEAGGREPK